MAVAALKTDKTKKVYGYLWTKSNAIKPMPEGYHFDNMQEVIPESIVRGSWGIDAGSGCGQDTRIMAKNNPSARIVSMDISDGVYTNSQLNRDLPNVYVVKGSMLQIPFKDGVFDFAYSFGVLHHTPDPQKGLSEIFRVIRKGSPFFLYLYEDHSENPVKYIAVKITNIMRMVTVKIHPRILYAFSLLCSPFIFIFFTCPSKILKKFKFTEKLSERIPFNFGNSPFSLAGDLYDRFGAPIEHRFSRKEVNNMFEKYGFSGINITRLIATAGWVAWGYKKDKDA